MVVSVAKWTGDRLCDLSNFATDGWCARVRNLEIGLVAVVSVKKLRAPCATMPPYWVNKGPHPPPRAAAFWSCCSARGLLSPSMAREPSSM